ncbi:MAG: anthranilate synthase component I family protein [Aquificae bacterium]|nr:anthranilate synthase component I family protein [Aquificota bacterium]
MSRRVVLESGFHPSGRRTYWTAERWFFFDDAEEFFKKVASLEGKTLLFFATFEGGFPFLNLPAERGELPPFGVAVLKESVPFRGGSFGGRFLAASLGREQYLQRFERIKRYIESGDVYQVNFTVRFDFEFSGDALGLWERFVAAQPVPFGAYFETPLFTYLGGSMELFLRKEGNLLKSAPIKGTLPSYEDPGRFFSDEKELAENLMITDMVRNDLARVALPGTVRVENLFKVESYETVHQLVSVVSCQTEASFGEVLKATFPPASVTGAPKRRAVEIIRELEPHRRELYCGTVGLILPEGDFCAAVAIRSALLRGNLLSYYAGGGVVYDSQGEREWREVLLKAEAFLRALKGS